MSELIRPWLKRIIGAVTGGRTYNLSESEAQELFTLLLDGAGSDAQLGVILAVMRSKGTTSEELVGAARAARERIKFPQLPDSCVVIATSRMGKRNSPPLGLPAAAVAAAAGVPVLLQVSPGLRGGGLTPGDLWQEMCGPLSGEVQCVDEMFANGPLACWNPTIADSGWQRLQRVEDETLLRGIPDVVTKLLFPEGARAMLAAVPGPVLGIAANALESLQHQHALIVQGVDGSLDPSTLETTRGMRLIGGTKAPLRIHPGDYALFETDEPCLNDESPLETAAAITRQVLLGVACPELSSTLISAGLIISLANPDESVATCIAQASEAVSSGAAQRLLNSFRNGN